ncbi:Plant cysteine oxidase 2 [Ananas comosus]|nr:Plant cysteine oxidase 2 [Ananas comosus]
MKVEGSSTAAEEEERKSGGGGGGLKRPRRVSGDGAKITRKRGCSARRARRRVQADSTAIQRLFSACRSVFKGAAPVPAPADVDMLRQLLDKMRPEDVGLSADLVFFRAKSASKGTPRITYTTIYKCNNFSMVIFFLPPRAVIPLHNHPGMTVFNKLLLGSMHVKSYDWVDPIKSNDLTTSDQLRLAKLVVDSDYVAPCNTSILYPATGGNIHTFRAITACAVLDVLGPPYSKEDDRDCTYYSDFPYTHHSNGATTEAGLSDERLGWLKEINVPKDLKMDGVEYLGPQIIDG